MREYHSILAIVSSPGHSQFFNVTRSSIEKLGVAWGRGYPGQVPMHYCNILSGQCSIAYQHAKNFAHENFLQAKGVRQVPTYTKIICQVKFVLSTHEHLPRGHYRTMYMYTHS